MKAKSISILILCWSFPLFSLAQYDSIVKDFKKEFNSFNQSIQQKHQGFKEKNDSIFSQFLKDSWASFDVLYKGKPIESKPLEQPKLEERTKTKALPSEEITADSTKINSAPIKTEIQFEKKDLSAPVESGGAATMNINFYGNESNLPYPTDIPPIKNISEESISNYFYQLTRSSAISILVSQIQNLKKKLQLNDWGYYKLVERCASEFVFDDSSKTLLIWIILIKSGFNAKTGFSGNTVFLMLPIQEELFNNYFVKINGQTYYILSEHVKAEGIKQLTIHKADYPENTVFSLLINRIPALGDKSITRELIFRKTKFTITQSEQLINFYKDYPMCEMIVYFSSPLSELTTQSLENFLNPLLQGLTDIEKVSLLLEFTQTVFSYQSDKDQFSREKYFFPDELFFYPFSDCEDRAILFTRLINHFTHLDCIALDYPGHVNTAVDFKEDIRGSFISVNGSKYTVCDPTYINAPIGYLPEEFKGISPKVIKFE